MITGKRMSQEIRRKTDQQFHKAVNDLVEAVRMSSERTPDDSTRTWLEQALERFANRRNGG